MLIDIILSNRQNNLCSPETILSSLSDHDINGVKRKLNNIKLSDITIQCRDYSSYYPKAVNGELSTVDWSDVNFVWNKITSILTETVNNHAPLIQKRVIGKRSPWLNRDLKSEMNRRDALHRRCKKTKTDLDYALYKRQRNRVNGLIRKAKNSHHKNSGTQLNPYSRRKISPPQLNHL